MKVKCNAVIFAVEDKERVDIRKLQEKELQVGLYDDFSLPKFTPNDQEDLRNIVENHIESLFDIKRFALEQLVCIGEPKFYEKSAEVLVTYLVILCKNDIQKMPKDFDFYSISISEHGDGTFKEEAEGYYKEQKISLKSPKKSVEFVYESHARKYRKSLDYTHNIKGKSEMNELSALLMYNGLKRLKQRLDNTGLAFAFLPQEFKISDIQQVYELILGEKLEPGNFRKKIEPYVVKTDKVLKGLAYRPSTLYRYNQDYINFWI